MFRGKGGTVETVSGQVVSAKQLYTQAGDFKRKGDVIEAKMNYQKILSEHSDFGEIEKVQKELEELNMNLIFSSAEAPDRTVIHEVQNGDTLGGLAKKYETTIDLIRRSNGLSGNVIKVGQK